MDWLTQRWLFCAADRMWQLDPPRLEDILLQLQIPYGFPKLVGCQSSRYSLSFLRMLGGKHNKIPMLDDDLITYDDDPQWKGL